MDQEEIRRILNDYMRINRLGFVLLLHRMDEAFPGIGAIKPLGLQRVLTGRVRMSAGIASICGRFAERVKSGE